MATWNIEFLDRDIAPERRERIQRVLRLLDADVVAFQEIADRASLERVLPGGAAAWDCRIMPHNAKSQDLAVALRRGSGWRPCEADRDRPSPRMVFPDGEDALFPDDRDILLFGLEHEETGARLDLYVVHAPSRYGGRLRSDPWRLGQAVALVAALRQRADAPDLASVPYLVLGDFNDSPDDRSLNVLESGDPSAQAGSAPASEPFLANLTEPLLAEEHCSWGVFPGAVTPSGTIGKKGGGLLGGRYDTRLPGTRKENAKWRGRKHDFATDVDPKGILFDQLLAPPSTAAMVVAGSVEVFAPRDAVECSGRDDRASDHLPVRATLLFRDK